MTLPKKNPTLSPNFYIWTVYTCPTFASSSSELYSWQALMPQHYNMNSSSNNRRRESGPWAHPSWALKALVGLNMIRYGECSSLQWLQIQQRGAKFSLSRCWWELYKFNEPSTTYTYTTTYILPPSSHYSREKQQLLRFSCEERFACSENKTKVGWEKNNSQHQYFFHCMRNQIKSNLEVKDLKCLGRHFSLCILKHYSSLRQINKNTYHRSCNKGSKQVTRIKG